MKPLLALACAAIVFAAGYFVWRDWDNNERARIAAEQQVAAQEAQEAAVEAALQKVSESLREAARAECLAVRDDLATVVAGGSLGRRFVQVDARVALRDCVADGHLDLADIADLNIGSQY